MFGNDLREYFLKAELATCCNQIGTVYLAQHKNSKEYVTVKKYVMEDDIYIRDEILIIRQFSHQNLLPFYTAFVNNMDLYVIVPLMCYGSCKDVLNRNFMTGFPEILICLIIRDILYGLEYLHRNDFIHRSIRACHILINQNKAVLCGFRESTSLLNHGERIRTLHNLPPHCIKGLNWLAPEVLEQNLLGYTEKSDVYSVGITLCELANGIEPFADMPTTFMFTEKVRGNQPTLLDNSTCPPDEIISKTGNSIAENFAVQTRLIYCQRKLTDYFHKFTEKCLLRNPDDRLTVLQLLTHSFFKQTKHTSLQEQFVLFGMDSVDLTKSQDDDVDLACDFSEMNITGNFEWDF